MVKNKDLPASAAHAQSGLSLSLSLCLSPSLADHPKGTPWILLRLDPGRKRHFWKLYGTTKNKEWPQKSPEKKQGITIWPSNCASGIMKVLETERVISGTLRPHGLLPIRLLCPWDFSGKNTAGDCHFFPQGTFATHRSNRDRLPWKSDSLPLSNQGSLTLLYYILKSREENKTWVFITRRKCFSLFFLSYHCI